VPKILGTAGFGATGRDVLFVVWDEQTGSTGGASTPMLLIAISPLAKSGPSAAAYNHESLLATVEDSFGLPRLGGAVSATPITDMWK
jgi:acid phosphatase